MPPHLLQKISFIIFTMPQTAGSRGGSNKKKRDHPKEKVAQAQFINKSYHSQQLVWAFLAFIYSNGKLGLNPHRAEKFSRHDQPACVGQYTKYKNWELENDPWKGDSYNKFRQQALNAAEIALKFHKEGRELDCHCVVECPFLIFLLFLLLLIIRYASTGIHASRQDCSKLSKLVAKRRRSHGASADRTSYRASHGESHKKGIIQPQRIFEPRQRLQLWLLLVDFLVCFSQSQRHHQDRCHFTTS